MSLSLHDLCRHFGLVHPPFARSAASAAILFHPSFSEALARIRLAIEAKTPGLLTSEPGLGKSTLLAVLSESLDKDRTRLVYTPLSACRPFGLVGQLAAHYGVRVRRTADQTAKAIHDELARSDKIEILVLDEAQCLPHVTLDELRLLCNTDFDRTAPFSLVLAGQPSLRDRLAEPALTALSQRIPFRAQLAPLSDRDTLEYVERRLRVAGSQTSLFRAQAMDKLFERSRGVPREINNLATGALLAAASAGRRHVEVKDVEAAIFEADHA
jgi:type II secretory pathway predicted ATPase ExeA